MTEDLRLYGDFEVEYLDSDGNVLDSAVVDDVGSFTIEDIQLGAMVHRVEEINIEILEMGTKRGDEQVSRYRRTQDVE